MKEAWIEDWKSAPPVNGHLTSNPTYVSNGLTLSRKPRTSLNRFETNACCCNRCNSVLNKYNMSVSPNCACLTNLSASLWYKYKFT